MSEKTGVLQRLFHVMKNFKREVAREPIPEIAGLRIELAECKEEIFRLRKEYALQMEQSGARIDSVAGEAVESLLVQFAEPLATLSAMQVRHLEKGDLNPDDVFKVAASFENILAGRGLQKIGRVGEEQPYEPKLHHMLDATLPHHGQPVRIRFPGFRFRGKLIAKARAGTIPGECRT